MTTIAALLILLTLATADPLRSRSWAVATLLGVFLLGVGLVMAWVGPAPVTV